MMRFNRLEGIFGLCSRTSIYSDARAGFEGEHDRPVAVIKLPAARA